VNRNLTVPNVVSTLRLLLVPWFLWLLLAAHEPGRAGVLLGIIGATDWVDGFLARRLGQVTELGKLLDPVADRLAVVAAVVAGLVVGILPAWFGAVLLGRELLVGAGALYGWTRGVAKLTVRRLGKVATLLLYVAITGFYLGAGFRLPGFTVAAYAFGIPGLVLYVLVVVPYARDLHRAVATRSEG